MVEQENTPIMPTREWLKENRKTTKTDGDGNLMVVDDPKYLNDNGYFHKVRRKPTNFTPKKKKRKKK
jgi:hypothetical protein